MAAASQKKRRTTAVYTTRILKVRDNTCTHLAADTFSDVGILIVMFAFPYTAPNCVLNKELLTDGLKVLISKEDELLYAARIHTLEVPDM